ncbi:hypothetical protein NQZ79_g5926 [Umbelopsis isabellina]|nr:hypothetical protein NQZ79_g5926 [Umbelopsis isabellina]
MLDPQDHSDFFADDESDNEVGTESVARKNYTSNDLEKELRDILGDEYDEAANVEVEDVDEQKSPTRSPTSGAEQKDELMRFIAQKEARIHALKEELASQEEELALLKETWTRVMAPTHSPIGMDRTGSPLSMTATSRNEAQAKEDYLAQASKAAYDNISKSVFSIFSSTQKALESENFQQTKQRAMSLSKDAMDTVQGRLRTVTESESFQSRKQTAFQVMESMVTKTADVIDRQLQLLEDSLDDPNSRPAIARSNTTGSIRDRPAQSP